MKGLTRRNLGLAAAGAALGGKRAVRSALNDAGVALKSVPHPVSQWGGDATAESTESIDSQRRRLLDRKTYYERLARGEFEDGDVARYIHQDATLEAINSMRSTSPAGKAHMINSVRTAREKRAMQENALAELKDIDSILKRLAGLG
jgi:hypothetical protein